MTTPNQIRGARAMLGLTQGKLAKLAGVTPPTIIAIEGGGDFKNSTMSAIRAALEAEGAVFFTDGGINIVPKVERIGWDRLGDPASRKGALLIVNAARKARGQPPLKDDDE